ncbi:hypothetical protein PHISCL_04705 [Aspergillus sclerotialis]|uniref:Uncharacterized protein n=1 Tax=Aspergillus sclerotialis TaxID=2070753 RepID=A0A3A2ZIQ0_9EURO|nr:hypothetical protein PHISCL_04705 [Aspergillus sclerotialis]
MTASYVQLAPLRQPPFFSHLQTPFVGMCLVDVRSSAWANQLFPPPVPSLGPSRTPTTPGSSESSNHSRLNPEALAFSPAVNSQLPTPPLTPPALQTPPEAGTSMHPVESMSSESNRNTGNPENTMEAGSSEKSLCDALFPTPPETKTSPSDKEMGEDKSQTPSDNSGTPFSSEPESSSSGSGGESMLEELKKALGIKERPKPAVPACERTCPMPNSPRDQNKKPFNQVQKKRRRSRRRSAKVVSKRRPGRRNVVIKKQPNAAFKRQQRREKWKQYEKKKYAPSQYWHMMMIPNWSLKGLRR